MSAVALISGGAGVAQAATIEPAAAAPAAATTLAAADAADTEAPARAVEGTFSYTQDAVSYNGRHAMRVAAHVRLRGRQGRGRHRGGAQRLVHGHRGRAGRRGGSDLLRDGLLLRYQRCRRRRHRQRRSRGRLPGDARPDGLCLGRHRPHPGHRPRHPGCGNLIGLARPRGCGAFSYPLGSQTLETPPPPEIDRSFERQSSIFRK